MDRLLGVGTKCANFRSLVHTPQGVHCQEALNQANRAIHQVGESLPVHPKCLHHSP